MGIGLTCVHNIYVHNEQATRVIMMGILARIPSEHPLQVSRLVIEGLAVRCFDAKHLEVQIFPNGEVGASGRRIAAQFMLQQGKGEFDRVVVRRISREVLEPHASD